MDTAPATPATSGDCDCTWSVRQLAFRLPSHWPIPRSTSGRWPGTSSRSTPICSAIGRARSSWPTRATPAPSSRASLPARAHDSSDRPRKARLLDPVNETLKGQLDLERHGGHTPQGVVTRVLQRLLALTAAIWHNHHRQQPVLRSLIAYDH